MHGTEGTEVDITKVKAQQDPRLQYRAAACHHPHRMFGAHHELYSLGANMLPTGLRYEHNKTLAIMLTWSPVIRKYVK